MLDVAALGAAQAGLYLLPTLVIVMAWPVVPSFPANALCATRVRQRPALEHAALLVSLGVFAGALRGRGGWSGATLALAAGALHAFAVGALGGTIIAMITHTALGHTARPLAAGRVELAVYLPLPGAAPACVAAALASVVDLALLERSAVLWSTAFLMIFFVSYALRRPAGLGCCGGQRRALYSLHDLRDDASLRFPLRPRASGGRSAAAPCALADTPNPQFGFTPHRPRGGKDFVHSMRPDTRSGL